MAKHTDRYDKNIIELAKKEYQSTQRGKLPVELVRLASGGDIYPESNPLRKGIIEMRYMTAYDEDILTNASFMREGVVLDKLLEALIVSDIDYNTVARVDKDSLLITARIVSYGKDYPVTVADPKTGTALDRVVDLSKLKPIPFKLSADKNGEFEYEVNDTTKIKFKFASSDILESIDEAELISGLLTKTITQVNDSRKSADIEKFIRYEFLAKDARKFRNYIAKNSPKINYEYEFEGEAGGTFLATFQIGSDFFWS